MKKCNLPNWAKEPCQNEAVYLYRGFNVCQFHMERIQKKQDELKNKQVRKEKSIDFVRKNRYKKPFKNHINHPSQLWLFEKENQ